MPDDASERDGPAPSPAAGDGFARWLENYERAEIRCLTESVRELERRLRRRTALLGVMLALYGLGGGAYLATRSPLTSLRAGEARTTAPGLPSCAAPEKLTATEPAMTRIGAEIFWSKIQSSYCRHHRRVRASITS